VSEESAASTPLKFVKYKPFQTGRIPPMQNTISVGKGRLHIAQNLVEQYLKDDLSVEVWYDDEQKFIALKPTTKLNPDGFLVFLPKKRKSYAVWAKTLVRFLRIKLGQYPAFWSPKHGMILFHYETADEATASESAH